MAYVKPRFSFAWVAGVSPAPSDWADEETARRRFGPFPVLYAGHRRG
jgi:hypothetical protein